MCSRHEAFGRVTVEAMGKGLPVIGLASGGTLEIIDSKKTGLLYESDSSELVDKMARLIGEKSLYERLSEGALEKARREYSTELYASRLIAIFQGVWYKVETDRSLASAPVGYVGWHWRKCPQHHLRIPVLSPAPTGASRYLMALQRDDFGTGAIPLGPTSP